MSSKAKPPPSKSSNKSGTSTKPTPKSGSPNKTAAKSGKTSTPTKDDTIHKLQIDLDACRLQNAVLRAQFNPLKIKEELQKEPIVSQDKDELFRSQIIQLMEEIHTLKSGTNQQDSKELDLLKEKNKQLEKNLKEANEKLAQSEPRLKMLEDMKRTLEKEKMELTQKIEEMKKEKDHQSKKSSESANGEVTKLKSALKEIEKQKEELESEVQSLSSGSANGEITKLKSELEAIQKQKDELESEVQSLRNSIEKLQNEKCNKESRIKELEGKCHDAFVDLERKGKEMKKLKDEHQGMIERKDKTIEELRKKSNMVDPMSPSSNIKEIEDERDELRKRLSEIISGKMTTNKPDIADLSDEFRPSKLGEMYSELYDNEWTDAFEEVESARGSEKAAIEYLLQILQEANSFIQKTATQYWEQAFKGILSFNGQVGEIKEDQLPGIVKKHLVDLLKKTSPYLKDIVGTVFVKQSKGQGEKEKLFRRHCAELCWMMRMQDPPVVLGSSTLSGNFNTSMYKEYTKRGSTVDFIVWPPLHLYENGPILSKGVAQGK